MPTYTNNSSGPRILNTISGPVVLAPGESRDDLELSKDEAASLEKAKLLEGDSNGISRSIADIQREIASVIPASISTGGDGELPPEDDSEVQSLKNDNTADELRSIADGEGVPLEGDDNKTDIARKIVAARNAA